MFAIEDACAKKNYLSILFLAIVCVYIFIKAHHKVNVMPSVVDASYNRKYLVDPDRHLKRDLAAAYRMFGLLGMDDLTYTHLSVRSQNKETFYIYPFGHLFDEVMTSNLLRVDFNGTVLAGNEFQYNQTGYMIHQSIYKARPEIQAIFHFHTPSTVAVSAHPKGLLPLSQWALHFYQRIAYHAYHSLALDALEGNKLVDDLQDRKVMLLRHHGALTCGTTLAEAFFYAYHLQQAAVTQCLMLGQNTDLLEIEAPVCQQTVNDLLSFEKNLGERDWHAMLRKLNRLNIVYDDLNEA